MGGKEWKFSVTVFLLDDVHIHTHVNVEQRLRVDT